MPLLVLQCCNAIWNVTLIVTYNLLDRPLGSVKLRWIHSLLFINPFALKKEYYTAKNSVIKVFLNLVWLPFYMKAEADSGLFSSCKTHIKKNCCCIRTLLHRLKLADRFMINFQFPLSVSLLLACLLIWKQIQILSPC